MKSKGFSQFGYFCQKTKSFCIFGCKNIPTNMNHLLTSQIHNLTANNYTFGKTLNEKAQSELSCDKVVPLSAESASCPMSKCMF